MRDNRNDVQISDGKTIGFCSYSNTIRQFPQNYMIAKFVQGVWVIDCDGAVDVNTGLMVSMAVMCTDGEKFNRDGNKLMNVIRDNYNTFTIDVSNK